MSDHPSTCRMCGGSRHQSLGAIPAGDFFAGRVLATAIPGGQLWHCVDCDSLFRHPILTAAEYRRLYEGGAAEQWSGDETRLDLEAVRSVFLGSPGAKRVLDVGCGSGDFLASLPATFERFGIEPSSGAAALAAQRGIRIAAPTLEELPADARFDVITIIDVIEHIPDPAPFLGKAIAHLAAGGVVVVSSGSPQVPVWRGVYGAHFWYCSFPEHISFPSRQFYERCARNNGVEVAGVTVTRYRDLPLWKAGVLWLIQLVYWASPQLLDWIGRGIDALTRAPAPRRQHFSPGIGGVFSDHWVVAIRRPG